MIDRIEIFVTELPVRVQRIFSSGSWDTGPSGRILGKPILVRIHADGVVGCAQIRPISPDHCLADTTQSVVAAIKEIYGPALLGRRIFDIEGINEMSVSLRINSYLRNYTYDFIRLVAPHITRVKLDETLHRSI